MGTWKLNKDKAPVFLPRYNPIPVYELIVISRTDNRFTLTFSHDSDKPGESDRLLVGDMNMPNTPFVGVDALNGKLMVYYAYVRRLDADSFTQATGISEENYNVLPDGKTMTVRQEPLIDNGFERKLVYDKVPDSPMTSFTRF